MKDLTQEMKEDLEEIYQNSMDYEPAYFTVKEWNEKHGEVEWNVGKLDGFYIADDKIEVR